MSTWTNLAVAGTASGGLGTTFGGAWAAAGGAGTMPAVLVDGSDASYFKKTTSAATDFYDFDISRPSIPANEVPLQVRWRCRMSRPASAANVTLRQGFTDGTTPFYSSVVTGYSGANGLAGITTLLGPWETTLPATATTSQALSTTALAGWFVQFADKAAVAAATQLTELGADLQTSSLPQAPTVNTPSGTVTDPYKITWTFTDTLSATVTNRASAGTVRTLTFASHSMLVGNDVTVATGIANYDGTAKITGVTATTITYTAPNGAILAEGTTVATGTATIGDGGAQSAYQVKVFSAAQYGIGGFDPAVSPNTYDSGIVASSANTLTPPTLVSGTVYRTYVRTAKTINTVAYWSAYGFAGFTHSVTPPVATLATSFDSANNRVQLTIAGSGNMLSADDANAETTVGTWTALTNAAAPTRTTAQAAAGVASVLMSSSAAGTMDIVTATGLSARPVIVGVAYSAIASFRAAVSVRTCGIKIRWYDSTGAFLSDSTLSTTGTAESTAAWVTRSTTATAPASAAFAAVVAEVQATAAGAEQHYVDLTSLHPGSTPAYSPGGMTYSAVVTRTPTSGTAYTVRPTVTLDAAQRATYFDYECPRGTSTTYSLTLVGTSASGTVSSAAVTSAVTATNDGAWWLKCVTTPALNKGSVRVLQNPAESKVENLGTYHLDGRTDTVVVSGQIFGDDIDFTVYTSSAAEFEAIKALLTCQGTLLLQEPFTDSAGTGLQRWVRVVERAWSKEGVAAAPRRVFTVKAVETGKGY